MAARAGAQSFQKRLGIAITTFNRRELVLELVAKIRAMTASPLDLVICDDGSNDGTVEAFRAQGEVVVGGANRGVPGTKTGASIT